jgi:hypothetical protein
MESKFPFAFPPSSTLLSIGRDKFKKNLFLLDTAITTTTLPFLHVQLFSFWYDF